MKIKLYKLVFFDILFFPFLKPFPLTLSMLPIFLWNLKRAKLLVKSKRELAISIIIVLAFLSLVNSFFTLPDIVLHNNNYYNLKFKNIVYFGLLLLLCIYFIYFKNLSKITIFEIINIFKVFLYFNTILAIVFWIDFQFYFKLRTFWTFGTISTVPKELASFTRFTGIFSDPNNASISFVAVYCYLLIHSFSLKNLFVLSFLLSFLISSTMSTTGTILFIMAFVLILFFNIFNKKNYLYLLFVIVIVAFFLFIVILIMKNYNITILELFFDRIINNSVDTRLNKIVIYFGSEELVKTFLLGQGGSVFINNTWNKPHIGHLHMIFNYSVYSWILFLYVFFHIRKDMNIICYLPLFILFIGFSINTGIIDFRFSMLFSIISAIYLNKNLVH